MTDKQRTDQQRKAIEVYCNMLSDCMNAAGYEKRAVFAKMREGFDIPWSQDSVKEDLFKPIVKAMFKKGSTTELEPGQVNEVYKVLDKWTSENLGITVEFPNRHGPEER